MEISVRRNKEKAAVKRHRLRFKTRAVENFKKKTNISLRPVKGTV